jgi:spermidine synthase
MATAAIGTSAHHQFVKARFVATIFFGSFLLFLVQPMIARMALPRLGGAPSVWNSAMLVYQALLLAGYAYAHWLTRLPGWQQRGLHLALFALAALSLPIGLGAAMPPADANSFVWVPWLLLVSIGPLFFVISAQAPLMQSWYAVAGREDPYPLYAASNFGSFLGLLAYPLLVEPLLPLASQRWLWSAGYVLLALLVGLCALAPQAKAAEVARTRTTDRPGWRQVARWILLSAVPSGLILATTLHLTTDIVAVPFLWVLPLGVYLLSFSVAFAANRQPATVLSRLAPLTLLVASCGLVANSSTLALLFGIFAVFNLFTISVALHSALFERRPDPEHLTFFYMMMSVGGVLGGIFCALVAPLIFDSTYENLILLVAAAFLLPRIPLFARTQALWQRKAVAARAARLGSPAVLLLSLAGLGLAAATGWGPWETIATYLIIAVGVFAIGNRLFFTACVAALLLSSGGWEKLRLSATPGQMTRSYFGIYSIVPSGNDARLLVHGTTIHGIQNLGSRERQRTATSYYAPPSGVGIALTAAPRFFGPEARIGVVGLGAGTLACYARPRQQWTFYEIDPAVVAIARDPAQFTFLPHCLPNVPVVVGDARIMIERAKPAGADVLVVDAFSSDSVPMHLLTTEAFGSYRRHLSPDGLLLVHISNRYLNLEPVIAAAAQRTGWHARFRHHKPSKSEVAANYGASMWVALAPDPATLAKLEQSTPHEWRALSGSKGFRAWTDDHASFLPLIRWIG